MPTFVYVLELLHGFYYVGVTRDVARRFAQHSAGGRAGGAAWTALHRPIRVAEVRRVCPDHAHGEESKLTAELMMRFGVNAVRGAAFCDVRRYGPEDADMLTRSIAHALDLPFSVARRSVMDMVSYETPKNDEKRIRRSLVCTSRPPRMSDPLEFPLWHAVMDRMASGREAAALACSCTGAAECLQQSRWWRLPRISVNGAVREPASGTFDVTATLSGSSKLQEAVDACPRGGSVLVVGSADGGVLRFDERHDVHLFGRGRARIRSELCVNSGAAVLVDGMVIEDDEGSAVNDAFTFACVRVTGGSMRLQNCEFMLRKRMAVHVRSMVEVHGCRFRAPLEKPVHLVGLFATGPSTRMCVVNCEMENMRDRAIMVDNMATATLHDNRFVGTCGILVHGARKVTIENNLIDCGASRLGVNRGAVAVYGHSDVIVSNNVIIASDGDGVVVTSGAYNVYVCNNEITTRLHAAVRLIESSGRIEGNMIRCRDGVGIGLTGVLHGKCVVVRNRVWGCRCGVSLDVDRSRFPDVFDNDVRDSAEFGVGVHNVAVLQRDVDAIFRRNSVVRSGRADLLLSRVACVLPVGHALPAGATFQRE